MAVTSVACFFWKKHKLDSYDMYAFPLAAGLIAVSMKYLSAPGLC